MGGEGLPPKGGGGLGRPSRRGLLAGHTCPSDDPIVFALQGHSSLSRPEVHTQPGIPAPEMPRVFVGLVRSVPLMRAVWRAGVRHGLLGAWPHAPSGIVVQQWPRPWAGGLVLQVSTRGVEKAAVGGPAARGRARTGLCPRLPDSRRACGHGPRVPGCGALGADAGPTSGPVERRGSCVLCRPPEAL